MRQHIWKYFVRIVFITWAIGLIVILYWQVYPYQVATIKEPIEILNENKEVAIGEPIIQELKIHKPNDFAPQDISRTLLCENGNLVTLTPTANNLPTGKYTLVNDKFVLPPKVSVGDKCIFLWRQSYRVNPIKVIPVEWKSETFTVINKAN